MDKTETAEINIPETISIRDMHSYASYALEGRNEERQILFEAYEFKPYLQEYKLIDKNKAEKIKHIFEGK